MVQPKKKRPSFFTYPACDPSAQRIQRRSCAPAPRASCPSPCLQRSGEACAAAEKLDLVSVAMAKIDDVLVERAESRAAMLRRAIGGGAAAVAAGGFCRNFHKSDSSLQRARAVARFWPRRSSWCTVIATAAWPATTSATSSSSSSYQQQQSGITSFFFLCVFVVFGFNFPLGQGRERLVIDPNGAASQAQRKGGQNDGRSKKKVGEQSSRTI